MAAQGAFETDFYQNDSIGTMLCTEYRPVIKIGPKGALGSHEVRPIHSAPSLGQSIEDSYSNRLTRPYHRVYEAHSLKLFTKINHTQNILWYCYHQYK